MALTSANFGELIEPGLQEVFYDTYNRQTRGSMLPVLYDVQTPPKGATVDILSVTGLGDWVKFNGSVNYMEAYEGYKKTFTHEEFVGGFQVQRKLVDDDLYETISQYPRNLAVGAARKREKDAASTFNDATSDTGPDGKSLLNDAHPSVVPGVATQDNKYALALSAANLQTVVQGMQQFKDSQGKLINAEPDELLVPLDLQETAWEIVKSEGKPDTANNNRNIHFGRYTLYVWRYLTDTNRWFVMDSGLRQLNLKWYDRVPVELKQTEDFDGLVAKFRGYARWSFGYTDWRWIAGSEPS